MKPTTKPTTKKNFTRRSIAFRDSTVSRQFTVVLFCLIAGFVAIGVAYFQVLKVNKQSEELENKTVMLTKLIGKIESQVLQARRQEKNFLLRNNLIYRDNHEKIVTGIIETVEELEKLVDNDNIKREELSRGNVDLFTQMNGILEDYRIFFNTIVDTKIKLGLDDENGLRRELANILKSLETDLKQYGVQDLQRSILLIRYYQSSFLTFEEQSYLELIGNEIDKLLESLDKLKKRSVLTARQVQNIDDKLAKYQDNWPQILASLEGIRSADAEFRKAVGELDPLLSKLESVENNLASNNRLVIRSDRQRITQFFVVILVATAVIITLFFVYLSRSITVPLKAIVKSIGYIAEGDLSQEIEFTSYFRSNTAANEISQLLHSLATMQSKLVEVIGGIREGCDAVSNASEQVSEGNSDLSQRTQEQASSLEEVAASMEEMTVGVNQNAETTQQASRLAGDARGEAEGGGVTVHDTVAAMREIKSSSQRIADIIGVINEIAFQTNLLALNAAVEAARAGDHGRGFAVVASEVRNLAGRSATAAKEIEQLIKDSVSKVEEGTGLADASGEALEKIVESVKKVNDMAVEIASASQQQSDGIAQVNKALGQMDEITQHNASLVEEAAAASEEAGSHARYLKELVAYFKLKEGGVVATPTASRRKQPARDKVQLPMTKPKPKIAPVTDIQNFELNQDDDWQEF